ncbi:hypothetical protein BBBOND_0304130 [Babesia bigemina]|uniref:Uncharacterized protein n=1 Tax=Babesia bigemina TaxID=5866 RepID=A0A061DC46_BABBI|nr:hypothetical protein BBBOND_0304130 [Babesia bigemina]CDR96509.1 hypothetical protein BBBOND_0304130 [Babesia bigemina]|eukprot:XP_012768695.1 hypothetical protein BBBOND_0304130 [Babesia bigemina]
MVKLCNNSCSKGDCATCVGGSIAIGVVAFPALAILVLYILGIFYNKSLGTIFAEIRDGFRGTKPSLH